MGCGPHFGDPASQFRKRIILQAKVGISSTTSVDLEKEIGIEGQEMMKFVREQQQQERERERETERKNERQRERAEAT